MATRRAISGGSRTASPARDDEPHRHVAASLPRTARNRPHGSGSPHLGITPLSIREIRPALLHVRHHRLHLIGGADDLHLLVAFGLPNPGVADRKSTRLNYSH